MSILVTDGDQRATLAVVRALGHEGVPVTVGSEKGRSLAACSRYCSGTVCYPSPQLQSADFQSYIADEMLRGGYRVLLPMTDITMQLAAGVRRKLPSPVQLAIPTEEQVRRVQDKGYVLQIARKLGIACPHTFILDSPEQLQSVAQAIRYPAVIKPRFSRWFQNGNWRSGSVEFADSPADLITKYRHSDAVIPGPLIQENIEGEGRGVFLLLWNGELKAAFCHRRLREKPPWGGVSVLRESIPLDQQLVQKSFALLLSLGWQGPAMVEYKVDGRDGQPKLMEINGRFWGSLQLANDAGLNFPLLFYRLACGGRVLPQFTYRNYVKSRWLLGDLDQLWIRMKNAHSSQGSSRKRALINFLKFYEPDLHYEVFRFEDPAPGWYEWREYLAFLLRQIVSRKAEAHAH
jgi:predicted ATP-grasp superfamily ATP-dependent carboligase